MQSPKTLDQAAALSRDWLLLNQYIRARLVQLVATKNDSVAVRAIDSLLVLGPLEIATDLKDVPTKDLLDARTRAYEYLRRLSVGRNRESGDVGIEPPEVR